MYCCASVCPVLYLTLLYSVVVAQLQNSKDVVAQAQAVAGLAAQLGAGGAVGGGAASCSREQQRVDDYIISILTGVMKDEGYFCR